MACTISSGRRPPRHEAARRRWILPSPVSALLTRKHRLTRVSLDTVSTYYSLLPMQKICISAPLLKSGLRGCPRCRRRSRECVKPIQGLVALENSSFRRRINYDTLRTSRTAAARPARLHVQYHGMLVVHWCVTAFTISSCRHRRRRWHRVGADDGPATSTILIVAVVVVVVVVAVVVR